MDPAYEMAEDLKGEVTIDGHTTKKVFKKHDQFAPELFYFSDCILNDKEPVPSGQEGLAAEIDRPASLPQVKIDRR